MEITDREPGVPSGRRGEAPLVRRRRLAGAPRELRMVGFRRLPRSLGGGILGVVVLVAFFAGLARSPGRFLVGLGLAGAALALGVWALVKAPIRPTFDQRWRPKARIRPLDLAGWRELAEELGAPLVAGPLPRLSAALRDVPVTLEFRRLGGARTVASAALPGPAGAELEAFPRQAEFTTKSDYETGDEDFDRAWHVLAADAAAGARALHPAARRWILAAEPAEFRIRKRIASVTVQGFTGDHARLRALVLAAAALAGADR